jgi:hypothetical protein
VDLEDDQVRGLHGLRVTQSERMRRNGLGGDVAPQVDDREASARTERLAPLLEESPR